MICDDIKITPEERKKEFVVTSYFKLISFGNLRYDYFVPFKGISFIKCWKLKKEF